MKGLNLFKADFFLGTFVDSSFGWQAAYDRLTTFFFTCWIFLVTRQENWVSHKDIWFSIAHFHKVGLCLLAQYEDTDGHLDAGLAYCLVDQDALSWVTMLLTMGAVDKVLSEQEWNLLIIRLSWLVRWCLLALLKNRLPNLFVTNRPLRLILRRYGRIQDLAERPLIVK